MIQDVRGSGMRQLLGANDTLQAWSGRYRVWAVDGKGEEADLMSGTFAVDANQTAMLGEVGGVSEAALLVIEWDTEGDLRRNHYVWGDPPFSFETYRDWCARLVELYSP
jgi:hypothetical protein